MIKFQTSIEIDSLSCLLYHVKLPINVKFLYLDIFIKLLLLF